MIRYYVLPFFLFAWLSRKNLEVALDDSQVNSAQYVTAFGAVVWLTLAGISLWLLSKELRK